MSKKKQFVRVHRDEYYLRIAYDVGMRSTCLRRQIGAVIVTGDVIVSTGYNGNPRGMPHCDDIGCIRDELNISSGERMEICTGVHAEMNALIFAGPAARNGTLYSTIVPCNTCAKMIVNAGIGRVVYSDGYPDAMGSEILKHSGVKVERLELKGRKPMAGVAKVKEPATPEKKSNAEILKDMDRMKRMLRKKFKEMPTPSGSSFDLKSLKKKVQKSSKTRRK